MGILHIEVSSSGVTALIGFAVQAKHRSVRSSYTLHLSFNPGDAGDGSLIDRGLLTTLPFVGPFCRSLGVQSTTHPWYSDPLTPVTPSVLVLIPKTQGIGVCSAEVC